ncbi:S8 family serine peptidase [Pseudoduganella namucuonensis]|uniref:Subtilase family protein n=1 Tax=Pseudoduganella namucuonensis TaxID=1035707 RepID=A0A1I7M2C6_9BURK|nr:S8 family serine peptidase [Pseudoduganella namucuonensis]SFV16098.1 Subtilase family protein [Pseudoduganella namucuonensis]
MENQVHTGARDNQPNHARFDRPRVVIRFREGVALDGQANIEDQIERSGIGPWKKLNGAFPGIKLSPVFTHLGAGELQELTRRAMRMDPGYRATDFGAFYYADTPPETDLMALVKTLLNWNSVETAYIDQAGPDPLVNGSDDPRFVNQGYLDPAPDGIDAEYAWGFAGGDGALQGFIDMERGWTLNHEDIAAHGATLLHGTILNSSRAHGTSVLGEICAVDNTVGCVGIVPNIASVNVVSFNGSTRPDAILAAITSLGFGEVLLLEAQVYLNGTSLLGPIEAYDAEYEAIRLATALGIVVVEAGGNGTNNGSTPPLNMDTYTTLAGRAILNRDAANPDFRDSGAIIVTAASSTAPHTRLPYAPHGKRIDCYAWGQDINTLNSDSAGATNIYTTGFGGTSGASPIITGAALAVQGRAEALLGTRFSPRQVRVVLSDPATGTPPAATETTQIRVMPNLRNIFDAVFNSAPDLYIRDFVGDTGEPHTGAVSASPDIILRPTPVADPQLAFGAGSGTENSAMLGYEAEAGQDNFIYVRVLNQGGSSAANVEATVYWSPVATLVTPDMWTLVGTATLPSVPIGEQLTVAPAIVWNQADIPGPGHYCFVGLIGNSADPPPAPADFLNWDNFVRFIQENNNVTSRNFNVEDNNPDIGDPTVPRGFQALKFLMPGAPDKARDMALELLLKLPEGARGLLEVPLVFYELLKQSHQVGRVDIDGERQVALIPVNPHGRSRFGDILLPARSRTSLRLLVQIPDEARDNSHQVTARQIWREREVGRVTWQLRPVEPPDPGRTAAPATPGSPAPT